MIIFCFVYSLRYLRNLFYFARSKDCRTFFKSTFYNLHEKNGLSSLFFLSLKLYISCEFVS